MAAQPPTTTDKSTDAAGPSTANGVQNGEKKLEHLGALEEDDEFEVSTADGYSEGVPLQRMLHRGRSEFPERGQNRPETKRSMFGLRFYLSSGSPHLPMKPCPRSLEVA